MNRIPHQADNTPTVAAVPARAGVAMTFAAVQGGTAQAAADKPVVAFKPTAGGKPPVPTAAVAIQVQQEAAASQARQSADKLLRKKHLNDSEGDDDAESAVDMPYLVAANTNETGGASPQNTTTATGGSSATIAEGRGWIPIGGALLGLAAIGADSGNGGGVFAPLAAPVAPVVPVVRTAPAPVLVIKSGEDAFVNGAENGVNLEVSYLGLAAGDVVQLKLAGINLGTAYTVLAADVTAGKATINVSKASLGADGAKSITAVATDATGGTGTSSVRTITVDTSTVAPTIGMVASDDTINSAETTGAIAGTAEAGASVALTLGTGNVRTVTANGAGNWTYTLVAADITAMGQGSEILSVTTTDAAGNISAAVTRPITVDTVTPSPALAIKSGQDAFVNASETSVDFEVSYAGLAAGDVIQLKNGAANLGGAYTVTAADVTATKATINVTKASLGADGAKSITAVATDAAGNAGVSVAQSITVDTTTPAPALVVKSGEDAIVNAAEGGVNLEVSYAGLAAGDVIQLKNGAANLGTAYTVTAADVTATKATLNVTKVSLGADGAKSITAVATDAAGNAGTSSVQTITLDTTAPSLVVKSGEDAFVNAAESGVNLEVSYTGLAAGNVIQLKNGAANLGPAYTVTAADVTATKATINVTKISLGADGAKSITAVVNGASTSSAQTITLDTAGPSPALTVKSGEDTFVNAAESGVNLEVSYAGLAAGDVVQLKNGAANLGAAYTVQAADVTAGKATINVTKVSLGADGAKSITAVATDAAGNTGTSGVQSITVDTATPAPALAIKSGEDAFVNAAESAVNLEVSYAGLAAGDVIQLKNGAANLGSAYTVTAGDVTATKATINVTKVSLGADGAKSITAVATDVAGNTGTSSVQSITVDTATPAPALAIKSGEDAFVNAAESGVNLEVSYAGLAAGDVIQLKNGAANLGAAYTVTAGDVTATKATINVTKVSLGADGAKSITAVATDAAGNTGTSSVQSITVDTATPAPALTIKSGENAFINASESGVNLEVSYAGLAAGDVIQLKNGAANLGSAYTVTAADVTATKATINITKVSLGADGAKSITAVATDAAGNAGTSSAQGITVDTATPAPALAIKSGENAFINASESGVNLEVSYAGLAAGDVVQLKNGAANLGSAYTVTAADVTAAKATINVTKISLGSDGAKSITAVATDAAGNAGTSSGQAITLDTVAPILGLVPLVLENGSTTVATMAASEAVTWNTTLTGTDAALFSLTAGGVLSFNTAKNYEAPDDAGADHVYDFSMQATDAAGNVTTQAYTLNLIDVNEAPTVTAPTADSSATAGAAMTSINAGAAFSDPDTGTPLYHTLTYSFSGAPAGVSIDGNTGVITGTPTVAGSYNVTVTASDGTNSVNDLFVLDVVSAPAAPALAAIQNLDGVNNLDVTSALVIAFDKAVTLNNTGTQHIKIFDDMGTNGWTVRNTSTNPNPLLQEQKQDIFDNDVDITMTNGVATAVHIGGMDAAHDYTSRFDLANSVKVSGNNLLINLLQATGSHAGIAGQTDSIAFDWDFGANYHVNLDAGVVVANGQGNAALTDLTTLNFTTVTPIDAAAGAASQKMDLTGASASLSAGYIWHNGHVSKETAAAQDLDFGAGAHALYIQSDGYVGAEAPQTTITGHVKIFNLGADDVLYNDNSGNMALLSTEGWQGATYSGSLATDTLKRAVTQSAGSDGGGEALIVDLFTLGDEHPTWTNINNTGTGGDKALENASHFNANVVIFG